MNLCKGFGTISLLMVAALIFSAKAEASLTCSENGTVVIYVNGVDTSRDRASDQIEAISDLGLNGSIDREGVVEYEFIHNYDEGVVLDFYEALIQKIAEFYGSEKQFEYYSLIRYGLEAIPISLSNSLAAIWLRFVGGSHLARNTERLSTRIIDAVSGENGGQKVLAISHSQGGLFLNAAYQRAVEAGGEKFNPKLFSALQVATPSDRLTSQGVYRTWVNDVIAKVPGSLSANIFD